MHFIVLYSEGVIITDRVYIAGFALMAQTLHAEGITLKVYGSLEEAKSALNKIHADINNRFKNFTTEAWRSPFLLFVF